MYYQIASPDDLNRFTSPSGLASITIPPGALNYERGIILMEYDIESLDRELLE